jgi:putative ABC transport system permease protein
VRAEVARQLRSEPGVTAVTMSQAVPFEEPDVLIEVDDSQSTPQNRKSVTLNHVDHAFFDAFGLRLLTGRPLSAGDADPARAVLVNQSFARKILRNGNPLGRRVRVVDQDEGQLSTTTAEYEIVGVVSDLFVESRMPTMYRPLLANAGTNQIRLTLRASSAIQPNLANRLREITTTLDPAIRVDDIQSVDEVYRLLSISSLSGGGILAGLTLCGVLFSVAGIYTSMVFTVVQRRREIGIRSALGAPTWNLIAGVFRQVLLPVGAGAAIGGLGATLLDYYLSPLLFDVAADGRPLPWILPAAEAMIFLIAGLALYGPVRRALRIDPMEAVREN